VKVCFLPFDLARETDRRCFDSLQRRRAGDISLVDGWINLPSSSQPSLALSYYPSSFRYYRSSCYKAITYCSP
jgi:hypothetical protein